VAFALAGLVGLGGQQAPRTAGRTPEAAWRRLRSELPATPRRPVADTYFGTRVLDAYRWLEDGDDPRVQRWMKQQDEAARKYLDGIPGEDLLARRLREILSARTVRWSRPRQAGGCLFVVKTEPPRQQPFLVVASGPDSLENERTVVDPNRLDPEGHTAIDWYRPSPDGKLVAVSLSRLGTEAGDLHLIEVATGQERFEVIPRVQNGTAGGDACWAGDGRGVFYTRYPRKGERPAADRDFYQQTWFHRLGTPVAGGSTARSGTGRGAAFSSRTPSTTSPPSSAG
jgi:prolyl oligopeptidase